MGFIFYSIDAVFFGIMTLAGDWQTIHKVGYSLSYLRRKIMHSWCNYNDMNSHKKSTMFNEELTF